MMANVSCGDCRYWEDFGTDLGQCRLNPPQVFAMVGQNTIGVMSVTDSKLVYEYPETHRKAWCGQHKPGVRKAS